MICLTLSLVRATQYTTRNAEITIVNTTLIVTQIIDTIVLPARSCLPVTGSVKLR